MTDAEYYDPPKESLEETFKCNEYHVQIWNDTQFMSSENLEKVAKFIETVAAYNGDTSNE